MKLSCCRSNGGGFLLFSHFAHCQAETLRLCCFDLRFQHYPMPQDVNMLKDAGGCLHPTNAGGRLRHLAVGQKARIVRVNCQGELGRRIRDMGLVPGAEVEVVGRAPLRDPVALRLKDYTLTLRNDEADYIFVETLPADPRP